MDRLAELEYIICAYYLGSYREMTEREIGLLEDELHELRDRNRETCPDCGAIATNYEFSEVTDLDCADCGLHMTYDYYDGTRYVYESKLMRSAMAEMILLG